MIPSAIARQLHQGIADYLRFSFWSSTPGMDHVIDDFLATHGQLLKGPYVSLKLPFVSGTNPRFFPRVPLAFMPHAHQEQAFERLGREPRKSTLIATGTGSGKTESFLFPILDHCLSTASQRGVKAILVYPMNALATDQAGRIARLIHDNDALRGRVTAGLYIGERGSYGAGAKAAGTVMSRTEVITDRPTMQATPPDILLTNYKMLDYLLLRPSDQGIWRDNLAGTLRFLVVDELHTFDGAQGTDLACLIRRLKRRVEADDGPLCCVGTSATLGGPSAGLALRRYAEKVFGEPFDEGAVIAETRLTEAKFLADAVTRWSDEPGPGDKALMDPARASDPDAWLAEQLRLWFPAGEDEQSLEDLGDPVVLGEHLRQHATFQALLVALGGKAVDIETVIAALSRGRVAWRDDPELARLAIGSLLGLVSSARRWGAELPEVMAQREADDKPRPIRPFLDVRLQLWQRELRRMVASLGPRPRLRHSDDLDRDSRRRHLPIVHCRDCGAMGWATKTERDKPHVLSTDLESFYRAFFTNDARVRFLFPKEAAPSSDARWLTTLTVELETLTTLGPGETAVGETMEVMAPICVESSPKGQFLTRNCPFCGARGILSLLGFQAATLTSVYIDQLFASRFNDDKKLLTFSDSVQDAAHRAGFFGARTWRTNLRIAIRRLVGARGRLTLKELADTVGPTWREWLDEKLWVSTFLAPNMAALHDWGTLQKKGELPAGSDLGRLIEERLAYEVCDELGLQSGIGRSLIRTGAVGVAFDPARVEVAVAMLVPRLQNEVPGLREVSEADVRRFVIGFLHHLRTRGGILARSLPSRYVESGGKDTFVFKQSKALPNYGSNARLPALLTDRDKTARFDTWVASSAGGWYGRWVARSLRHAGVLQADVASTYPVVLPALMRAGLIEGRDGDKDARVWGLAEAALIVTTDAASLVCGRCRHRVQVATEEAAAWVGLPCVTARCEGAYALETLALRDYFGRLYAEGNLERIFTAEHTGLLDRNERELVEKQFKAVAGEDEDPDARRPWYPNLLSCTPTLEMGIDIGDLSSVVLCGVPPGQANYLQRIGRAGRRDGNAFVLTVAGSGPHDLYFYAEPEELIDGEVSPPGVFLDAPAVLERQLTAFCFDRWAVMTGEAAELPKQLRTVFAHLDDSEASHFPHNLVAFVEAQQGALLSEFQALFKDELSRDTVGHLSRFLRGDDEKAGLRWGLVDALHRERKQRDSLAGKARALREIMKAMKDAAAKPTNLDEELALRDDEKEALLALVKGINERSTLEFLTDEGLLPNYAFPESAVRLSSVIWRKKKKEPAPGSKTSKYETWHYEYKRSPASALSELVPHADFYAGGRKVHIDQVDVAVSEVEAWRFCDACNHAQRIDTGDDLTACPACESANWKDDGQKAQLLRLRQVFASTADHKSRIRDDQDERRPKFFQRQILVDVADEDRAGAWMIDDTHVPFGFEFLRRATFREVNFGEKRDQGKQNMVAGRQAIRPGFEICTRCGKVQPVGAAPADAVHALTCPSRKPGAKQHIEPCLYLYREFASEALRMLLPMTDLTTGKQLSSFVAALQVGLKARFGGSVDHLHTTVYSDPIAGGAMRKQYLVVFDTVPGGTGYLAQLVTPKDEGAELPIFEVMELALARIESCGCWDDPERDGCYRCLYAYRSSREMDDTSAQVASELLRSILAGRGKVKVIESLSGVSISGLMDSVLEVRFVEALRQIGVGGAKAKLRPAIVNQKPGYRWTLGPAEWEVEPQVNLTMGQGAGIPVSIDFALRPAQAKSERLPIAVFLDGWEYHKDRVGQDLRQRMALLASGQWDVWTFTWADLDQKLGGKSAVEVTQLAVPNADTARAMLERMGLVAHKHAATLTTFELFEQDLLATAPPWTPLGRGLLAARMRRAADGDAGAWLEMVARVAPPIARAGLAGLTVQVVGRDAGALSPHFELMAVHDGKDVAVLCTLDDRVELHEDPAYKAAWHGYLRLFQVYRGVSNAWFMTRRGSEEDGGKYHPIGLMRGGAPGDQEGEVTWDNFDEIGVAFRALAERLMAAGVAQPVVGSDVPDMQGDAWAEGELVWDDARVAVMLRSSAERARGTAAADWVVLFVDDLGGEVGPVLEALQRSEVV